MTLDDYAKLLRRMHQRAPKREKTMAVKLFGIKYGPAIREMGRYIPEVVRRADIGKVGAEVSGGANLAPFVELKESSSRFFPDE